MSSLLSFYDEITDFGSVDVEKLCKMRQDFFDKTGKWIKMTSTAEVIEERGFDQSMEMLNDINVLFEYLFREMIYWAEEEFGLNDGQVDTLIESIYTNCYDSKFDAPIELNEEVFNDLDEEIVKKLVELFDKA